MTCKFTLASAADFTSIFYTVISLSHFQNTEFSEIFVKYEEFISIRLNFALHNYIAEKVK